MSKCNINNFFFIVEVIKLYKRYALIIKLLTLTNDRDLVVMSTTTITTAKELYTFHLVNYTN